MLDIGYSDLSGRRDLMYDPKDHSDRFGRFDLVYHNKRIRSMRGRRDLLYDPKECGDFYCQFDLASWPQKVTMSLEVSVTYFVTNNIMVTFLVAVNYFMTPNVNLTFDLDLALKHFTWQVPTNVQVTL